MQMGARPNHLVSYFDAPADKPTVVEFVDHLEARSTLQIVPYGTAREQEVRKAGSDKFSGAGLAVQWVEIEGPLSTWPPAGYQRLFGDVPLKPQSVARAEAEGRPVPRGRSGGGVVRRQDR